MEYYRELLDAAFQALSRIDAPSVLTLVPDFAFTEIAGADSNSERHVFPFPTVLQPSNTDLRQLPEGEPYLEKARTIAENSTSDCIFAFLPLVGQLRLSPEFRDQFGSLGLAEAIVTTLVERANCPAKVFAFLVPPQFLATMRCGKWRQQFFPDHSAVVIEPDQDLSGVFTFPGSVCKPFCTVLFTKTPGAVRFFKISSVKTPEPTRSLKMDLQKLIRQPAGKTQYGYVYQGSLEELYPTSFDFYSGETERLRQEVSQLGERVHLGQIAEILTGFRSCHPELAVAQGVKDFLTIGARDITADGRVDLTEVHKHEQPAQVLHYLQEGDLCVRQIYSVGSGFMVGVYAGDGRRITWRPQVIVVRPKAVLLPVQRQILFSFLRSPLAQRLGSAEQQLSSLGGNLRVSPFLLQGFPVPIADQELMTAMEHLSDAKQAFQTWISDINDASDAIVRESTASGSRQRILQSGQLARQRFRAATQVEELDYRIRTQFPHPLAYVWREFQVSGPDRYHRLRAVTKAAEANTCFLAQLAILLGRTTGKPIAYANSIATRLSNRPGGTNFGDWFAIVKEINESRAFRNLDDNFSIADLRTLCADGDWEPPIRRLMDLRNDDGHLRIHPASVSAELLANAEADLEIVFRTTEFLTDYRLIQVTETRFDSIRQLTRYQYRDLTGDNALAPLRSDEAKRNDLEAGSLYLMDRRNELHLLRPMLSYLECPECHQMSTFFLDTFDKSESEVVGIKSFERNSVRHEQIAADFRHVGLLK